MQGHHPVKTTRPQLGLDNAHLRFSRSAPELAVQVLPGPVDPGAVLVTGGVDHGVDPQLVAQRALGFGGKGGGKLQQRGAARRFVAVHPREETKPHGIGTGGRAGKTKPGNFVRSTVMMEVSRHRTLPARAPPREFMQWMQQSPLIQ